MVAMILFLLLAFLPDPKITGTVIDAETNQPVQFATVYFANTTIGVVTDVNGEFTLENIESGKYDLTVSFVGYETLSYPVEVTPNTTLNLRFELKSATTTLPEVYVTGDRSDWLDNFEIFKRHFFGRTEAAAKCEIANTDDLFFYFNDQERTLTARASAPLEVVNKWLGYRLYFDLERFHIDYESGRLEYFGIPRFEELEKSPRKSWLKRREEAYYGSVMHFFRSMYVHKLDKESYYVQELVRIPNPNRLTDSVINLQVNQLKEIIQDSSLAMAFRDSVSYQLEFLAREKRKPTHVLVTGEVFTSGEKLIDDSNFTTKGIFQVNYNGRKRTIYAGGPKVFPKSTLYLNSPVHVYANGYYEDIQSLFLDGDWSNFDTIASMLPLDYKPAEP